MPRLYIIQEGFADTARPPAFCDKQPFHFIARQADETHDGPLQLVYVHVGIGQGLSTSSRRSCQ